MCRTPWCGGECDECIADKKAQEKYEDENISCPHRKECNWETIDVKHDRCKTCGHIETYP